MMTCKICGSSPDEVRFYTGVKSRCADCHKAAMARLRAENRSEHQARDRARYPKERASRLAGQEAYRATAAGREAMRRGQRAYIARNPKKRAAHIAVGNALRDGKLLRPAVCDGCAQPARLHAHHDDYDRPLDVRWLCVPCHETTHHDGPAVGASQELRS